MNHWKAHEGLILASGIRKKGDQLLYISGGNDSSVSIWDISQSTAEKSFVEVQNGELAIYILPGTPLTFTDRPTSKHLGQIGFIPYGIWRPRVYRGMSKGSFLFEVSV